MDIAYYLPLFLHYYGLKIEESLNLDYSHFLALAKGIEIIEARRTHGLITAIKTVLNADQDTFSKIEVTAFDLDKELEDSDEIETEAEFDKRIDDFIHSITRGFTNGS